MDAARWKARWNVMDALTDLNTAEGLFVAAQRKEHAATNLSYDKDIQSQLTKKAGQARDEKRLKWVQAREEENKLARDPHHRDMMMREWEQATRVLATRELATRELDMELAKLAKLASENKRLAADMAPANLASEKDAGVVVAPGWHAVENNRLAAEKAAAARASPGHHNLKKGGSRRRTKYHKKKSLKKRRRSKKYRSRKPRKSKKRHKR